MICIIMLSISRPTSVVASSAHAYHMRLQAQAQAQALQQKQQHTSPTASTPGASVGTPAARFESPPRRDAQSKEGKRAPALSTSGSAAKLVQPPWRDH